MSDFYKIGSKWQSKKDEKFIICICDIKPFVKPHGAYQVFGLSEYHRTEWLSHEDLEQWYIPFVETQPDPESVLRYQHLQQYEQMLEAAQARIAELEAVCREVVAAFEIEAKDEPYYGENIEIVTGPTEYDFEYYLNNGNVYYTALRHLLDTLPPSE